MYNIVSDKPRITMKDVFFGPEYNIAEILRSVKDHGLDYKKMTEDVLIHRITTMLLAEKTVGIFHGRMEFGPRALGHRSIIANPAFPEMKDYLNNHIKDREWWRPYGISILREFIPEVLDIDLPNRYMLFTGNVREKYKGLIPAAMHIDGSTRYQSVDEHDGFYYRLLKEFHRRTGIPAFINTSFNHRGEPIVCSPEDALCSMQKTGIDSLAFTPGILVNKQKKTGSSL
ncbi:MAG: carbamoyltransferase C-terminal domain-containing protein [Candidatus Muiribacteriaceae bacterium]